MNIKNIILIAAITGSLSSIGNADAMQSIRNLCPENNSGDIVLQKCTNVNLISVNLDSKTMKSVYDAIDTQSGIWGDTILEGDVDTNYEDLQIESIQLINNINDSTILGYSVKYSYLGWETSCALNDKYDRTKPSTYTKCKKGRIREIFFLDQSLKDSETLVNPDLFLFHP
jgi:hypothetical protein